MKLIQKQLILMVKIIMDHRNKNVSIIEIENDMGWDENWTTKYHHKLFEYKLYEEFCPMMKKLVLSLD